MNTTDMRSGSRRRMSSDGNVVAAAISFMGLKDVHDNEACWTYYWRERDAYVL